MTPGIQRELRTHNGLSADAQRGFSSRQLQLIAIVVELAQASLLGRERLSMVGPGESLVVAGMIHLMDFVVSLYML